MEELNTLDIKTISNYHKINLVRKMKENFGKITILWKKVNAIKREKTQKQTAVLLATVNGTQNPKLLLHFQQWLLYLQYYRYLCSVSKSE